MEARRSPLKDLPSGWRSQQSQNLDQGAPEGVPGFYSSSAGAKANQASRLYSQMLQQRAKTASTTVSGPTFDYSLDSCHMTRQQL